MRVQVIAVSATYTPELLTDLEPLMKRPQRVMLCEEGVSLRGVAQFYKLMPHAPSQPDSGAGGTTTASSSGTAAVPPAGADGSSGAGSSGGSCVAAALAGKVASLLGLLSRVPFHQAAIFLNHKPAASWLADALTSAGFPAAYLSGEVPQVSLSCRYDY